MKEQKSASFMCKQWICPSGTTFMPQMQIISCTDRRQFCQCINTSYEFTTINNMTRSTGIHTLHIIDISPWTNMPATLHIYPTALLLTSTYRPIITTHINNITNKIYLYDATATFVRTINMSLKCHILKLLNLYLCGKYANKYATYDAVPINNVARTTVHKQRRQCQCRQHRTITTMTPQPNYVYWVGYSAKSIKKACTDCSKFGHRPNTKQPMLLKCKTKLLDIITAVFKGSGRGIVHFRKDGCKNYFSAEKQSS